MILHTLWNKDLENTNALRSLKHNHVRFSKQKNKVRFFKIKLWNKLLQNTNTQGPSQNTSAEKIQNNNTYKLTRFPKSNQDSQKHKYTRFPKMKNFLQKAKTRGSPKHKHHVHYLTANSFQTGGAGVSKDALRNKRRVVKLVTIVTVMFALSWLPIQVVLTMIMIVVILVKDIGGVPK